ncbi:aldo/keto reductase [Candidatus Poribacteria bacterium]
MPELETRRMGRTEMRPKSLGLGAAWLSRCPESQTIEAIQRAFELGINYFDTYPGHEERRWAKALKGHRDEIYLQAKIGTHPDRRKDFSTEGARWSVENSLKELETDYLDALLIHDPPDIEDPLRPGRALDELLKMKEEGLIKAIGLGVRQHEFHRRAIETGHIDLVLTHSDYHLLSQSVAQTTLPLARKHDVGIMLATVLGRFMNGTEPDGQANPQAYAMWQWCRDRGFSIRDFALQFALAAPIDGIVVLGVANKQQVEEGYASATVHIPPEIWSDFKDEFGVGIE